jgi:hypothetical protein
VKLPCRSFLVGLSIAANLIFPLGASTPAQVAPDLLRASPDAGPSGPALWISAKAAADSAKVLRWDLLGTPESESPLHDEILRQAALPHEKHATGEVADIPEGQCSSHIVDSGFTAALEPPADTLDDLIHNSIGIYAGTIEAINPGFSFHSPYSLLTVRIGETLRAPESGAADTLFVLHPVAHFHVGDYNFCGAASRIFGDPQAGDQVLVFVYQWLGGTRTTVAPVWNQLALESRGKLFLPPSLAGGARPKSGTFNDVLEVVRRRIADSSHKRDEERP